MAQNLNTHAYFDPTDATLTIVTAKAQTVRTVPIPDAVLNDVRAKQATWVRTQIRKTGAKPIGRDIDYPYGFYYAMV